MLQKNVKIGETYLTYIGKELRRVRVDREVKRTQWGYRSGDRQVTRFICTELRTGKELPKPRSSGSLREEPKPIDVRVTADSSPATVYAFELRTPAARKWVAANVYEPQFLGESTLVVEHRYAPLLVEGLQAAGLTVA